ncbi:hypothetical protein [Pelagibius sp.]|uniref:hypothetical protein n=1 Tax=Pelagibius sp. TaxID=1931238 RepID=UPI003B514DA0
MIRVLLPVACLGLQQNLLLLFLATAFAAGAFVPPAAASGQSSEFSRPDHHFSVDRPADLSPADAMIIYDNVRDRMAAGYRLSHDPAAERFVEWRRYNSAPYRSATHGQRFVNNYANAAARAYGDYENAAELPVGSILAKDSFAVTQRGDVFTGPLFLMEKMPEGFRPEAHDWRYTMIMPDGSLFGTTNGEGNERVEFCITCHEAVGEDRQQLFFVPRKFRVEFLNLR